MAFYIFSYSFWKSISLSAFLQRNFFWPMYFTLSIWHSLHNDTIIELRLLNNPSASSSSCPRKVLISNGIGLPMWISLLSVCFMPSSAMSFSSKSFSPLRSLPHVKIGTTFSKKRSHKTTNYCIALKKELPISQKPFL